MKRLIPIILTIPILISCNTYNGPKYELHYDNEASLKELTPKEMFNISAINKTDSVFLIGLDGCSACDTAKKDTLKYINKYHASIYYIDMNKVTYADDYTDMNKEYDDNDYYYLYQSTVYQNQGVSDINSLPHPNKVNELNKKNFKLKNMVNSYKPLFAGFYIKKEEDENILL